MQIVIEIPEKIYSYITTQWRDIPKNDSPISIMCNAVIDGTPLPKGHGDLIDRDDLLADSYCIDDWSGNEVDIVDVKTVKMADAIIEADGGGEDEV